MELREAIRGRRSIRHFLPKPVSKKIIEDLIADTLWAPSWGNTQPWEIVAVTGEPLERFKNQNRQALINGNVSHPEIVRELFSVPENKRLVMGVALGWPAPEAPVNRFERQPGRLDEFVKWVK